MSNIRGVIAFGVGICRTGEGILGGGDANGLFSRSGRSGIGDDDILERSSPGENHLNSVICEFEVDPSSPLVEGNSKLDDSTLDDPWRNGVPCGEKWGEPSV